MSEARQLEHRLLMTSWDRLREKESEFVSLFYAELFKERPDYRQLFTKDMGAQELKFTEMVNTLINSLQYLDALKPVLRELGVKHVYYGVQTEDYDVVIRVFLKTLKQVSLDVSAEELGAWENTLFTLKDIMTTEA